jgi:DNA-binding transcriptional ArsR family regulator
VKAALPPSYVNAPVPIAYAEAVDALIVTTIRILRLCWTYDYERTPALTPEQVACLTGRPRSTLYRHLKELREKHWIRVDQADRKIIIFLLSHCSRSHSIAHLGRSCNLVCRVSRADTARLGANWRR